MRGAGERARRVLRERWWLVLVVLLAFAGIAAAFELQAPKAYTGTAELSVAPAGRRAPLAGVRPLEPPSSDELGSRVGRLLRQPDVFREVSKRLKGTRYSASAATLRPSKVEGWLEVVAIGPDAEFATRVATEYARVLADRVSDQDRERIDQVIDSLRRQRRSLVRDARALTRERRELLRQLGSSPGPSRARLRRLAAAPDPLPALSEIQRQLARLEVLRRTGTTARVAVPAQVSEAKALPRGERTLTAALFGLSLGLVAAFVADALGRRPRDPAKLAAAAGVPVSGYVPRRQREAERAYDMLRIAVEALIAAGSRPVVVVTPASSDDEDCGVAAGLARSAALAGRRVSLVTSGTPALAGSSVQIEPPPVAEAAADTLAALSGDADLVVVDAPAPVRSALALAAADGAVVVICARAGRTSIEEAAGAAAAFGSVDADLRLVITNVAPADMSTAPQVYQAAEDARVPAGSGA